MVSPRVLVLRAAGTNCDQETRHAFEIAGATVDLIHVNRLIETRMALHAYHALVLPGGFTYGDDVSAGKVLAVELRNRLGGELVRFVSDGKLVLGICNGFQALVKLGLLPGRGLFGSAKDTRRKKTARMAAAGRNGATDTEDADEDSNDGGARMPAAPQEVTLTYNDCGRFESRWVHLQVTSRKCVFLNEGAALYLPIAHGEGKFVPRDAAVLKSLQDDGQVVLRYVDAAGKTGAGFPHNPNGSLDDVAGLCDPSGRILGLMPHPERHVHATHHPRWTREGLSDHPDGLGVFENAVRYMKKHVV